MTTQTTGLLRNTIDKYYTRSEVVKICINAFREHINLDISNSLYIEPSAGNGAFIEDISSLPGTHLFYDIMPEHPKITQQDYLTLNVRALSAEKIHVIGNPPFGRQSSLAKQFIQKSASYCDTIAFILPRSFKKPSMQNAFPPNFHLVYCVDLQDNSFCVDSKYYNVPCVFQIWEKRSYPRPAEVNMNPEHFEFVKKTEDPHISVRRVGVYAGKIDSINIAEKSEQSHYFIRFTNTTQNSEIEQYIKNLQNITFEFNNTVGPKSISKQELIRKYNEVIC